MSPYLFTLVMEVLTLMLHRRVSLSESFTYHRYCSDLNIVNLCIADDLFLFSHGDANSAKVIMDSLEEFKNASGLTPSLPKSTAYFCNVLNYVKIDILSILPFEEGTLPVEKVKSRINDWKNKSLSFAGLAQLILSVLASMHVYWALVFILPSRLMHDHEQLMRCFLWCQGDMHKGKAKVSWEVVCLPKNEGGLGIWRLEAFNTTLITSHILSIISHKEFLWVKWIHTHKLRGRTLWEIPLRGKISWGWQKILQVRPTVRQFIWSWLGDGSRVSVCFDNWCPISPLAQLISSRDIYGASFQLSSKVWEHMRLMIRIPNMPSSLDLIVDFLILIAKKRNEMTDAVAAVEASLFSYPLSLMIVDHYIIWMKMWPRDDSMHVTGEIAFGCSGEEDCQLRVVLFFLHHGFSHWVLSWEGCLKRQSQLVYYTPSVLMMARCGDSCALKWLFPIGDFEERVRQLVSSLGASSTTSYSPKPSTPPSYSSGPSTPPSYSPGPSRNAECSNCKHLLGKITVRIYQKSQENSQKRANTNTEIRRAQKKPRIQEKSTMVKLQSKKVKPWSTEVNH
ncbi:putative reverse transcriptase domain, reverse transcriptase zinc-binding domain protein [Tanacetum coccineum]